MPGHDIGVVRVVAGDNVIVNCLHIVNTTLETIRSDNRHQFCGDSRGRGQ
jgi:hypothetical protein